MKDWCTLLPSVAAKDSNIFLFDVTNKEIAKYQLKGNTTSRLSNLVFEPVEKAAGSARLGKAPLQLVAKLAAFYDKSIYNDTTKDNANYPKDKKEFTKRQKEYEKMYDRLSKNPLVKEIGVRNSVEFLNNFQKAFDGPEPWIANIKLMQMYFIDKVLQLNNKKRDTQKDLESVSTGKTTVTTLFKNSSDAGSMANKIDQHEREINSNNLLLDLLSAYLGNKVIPAFKKEKLQLYHRILQQFTVIFFGITEFSVKLHLA